MSSMMDAGGALGIPCDNVFEWGFGAVIADPGRDFAAEFEPRRFKKAVMAAVFIPVAIAFPVALWLASGSPLPFLIFPPLYVLLVSVEVTGSRMVERSRRVADH